MRCRLYYRIKNNIKPKPEGRHKHVALILYKKERYYGWNSYKTNPRLLHQKENGYYVACYHAETHALFKVAKEKRSDITIYVARIRKDGSQGYSKPCKHCTDILLSEGVSPENIWYTTDDGMWTNLIGQNKEL